MIDIVDVVAKKLEDAGLTPVRLRPLKNNEEGICIRRIPSAVVATYMDGTQEIAYLFEVYVRYLDEERAIIECETAIGLINMANLPSANGSYRFISCGIYSHTTEVERRTDGKRTYKVGFKAEIETQG